MKQSKTIGLILKVIASLFFILAIIGFYHMVYGKFPANPPVVNKDVAYKSGYSMEKYVEFYLVPFFEAFIGYLFFQWGNKKMKLTNSEEQNT